MPIDPVELAAAIADAIARGAIPGLGSAQGDSFKESDNADAAHPLNVRYVIPSNVQRIVTARLSFHLAPYRTYDQTAAAAPHIHYRAWGSQTDAPVYYVSQNAGASKVASRQTGGGGTPPVIGFSTSTEHAVGSSQAGADSTSESYDNNGHTHAQTLGVTEGATATGVTVKFDGVDKTSALGGGTGFTTDQVELDVTQYIQKIPDKAFHLIALTPTANGRIEAHLRLSYFANAGIPA